MYFILISTHKVSNISLYNNKLAIRTAMHTINYYLVYR